MTNLKHRFKLSDHAFNSSQGYENKVPVPKDLDEPEKEILRNVTDRGYEALQKISQSNLNENINFSGEDTSLQNLYDNNEEGMNEFNSNDLSDNHKFLEE